MIPAMCVQQASQYYIHNVYGHIQIKVQSHVKEEHPPNVGGVNLHICHGQGVEWIHSG